MTGHLRLLLVRTVEEALVALKMAGARRVTVVFDLAGSPSLPSSDPDAPPEPSTAPATRSAVAEALADDPLYRSTSSRPVRVDRAAEEDDDGLD